jgi:RNA polymerase sigma factor (sigma-70 family)
MNEDLELLRRYIESGSNADFTALVQRHIGLVYATALRTVGGDAHLAQDVAQSVFTDLARKARSLRDRSSIAGWLYVGTRHAAAAIVRREQRRKTRELHAMSTTLSPEPPNPEWERIRPVLDDAMTELGETDREAVVLRFFQQRTLAEVGAALRVTEEAARKRVDRALDKLRDGLTKRGIVSTAAALTVALSVAPVPVPSAMGATVAGRALESATTTLTTTFVATSKAILPFAAVLAIGGWLIGQQHASNTALKAQLTALQATQRSIAILGEKNKALKAQLATTETRRQTAAELPALRAEIAQKQVLVSREPAAVMITTDGRIKWGERFVTLDRFLRELKAANAMAANGESSVVIHAPGAGCSAIAYAIDEARKAGIQHLVVDSDTPPDLKVGPGWF